MSTSPTERTPADAIVETVLAVPGVVRMHTGSFGEVATYLPGRRVEGVRVREDVVEVHVVLAYGHDVLGTAQQIRTAVAATVSAPVHVFVEDVSLEQTIPVQSQTVERGQRRPASSSPSQEAPS